MGKRKEVLREKNSYLCDRIYFLLSEIKSLAHSLKGKVSEDENPVVNLLMAFIKDKNKKDTSSFGHVGDISPENLPYLKQHLEKLYSDGKDLYKKHIGKEWEEKE